MSEENKNNRANPQDGEKSRVGEKQRKLITMAISLVAAILLWGYVMGEVNPTMTVTMTEVPVTFSGQDVLVERGLAVQGGENFTVDIAVKGNRSNVNKLKAEDVFAAADLSQVTEGKNYLDVSISLPAKLELQETEALQILVTIEALKTRTLPVEVAFNEETEEGTEIGNVTVSPSKVKVAGAESDVNEVACIQVKVDTTAFVSGDIGRAKGTIAALNSKGREIKSVTLSEGRAVVSAKLLQVKEVPLRVVSTGIDETVQAVTIEAPETVKIKGTAAVLEAISYAETEPLDVSGIKDSTKMPLTLHLPEGVEAAKGSAELKADVMVEEYAEKTFSVTQNDIVMQNQAVGTKAIPEEKTLVVTVSGTKKQLQAISQKDLTITANLQGSTAGTVQAALAVSASGNVHKISIDPRIITVIISAAE